MQSMSKGIRIISLRENIDTDDKSGRIVLIVRQHICWRAFLSE